MTEQTYNGWTNYETWNVALWLDNDRSSYDHWREAAQAEYDEARDTPSANAKLTGQEPFTHEERAVLNLERRLKSEIEDEQPDLGASMWSDLLSAALSEVNWHEIAAGMIEEVNKEVPESAE